MSRSHAALTIKELEMHVHLGWHSEERHNLQKILLTVSAYYEQPPKACDTDDLADSSCYAKLINDLYQFVANKHFALIEHLCKEVHQKIKEALPQAAGLTVEITKFPAIKGLNGGVTFTYI